MARIEPLETQDAPPAVRALYGHLREELFIEPNNFFKTIANAPELLGPLIAFSRVLLEEGSLDRRLKEWVILQTGRLNHCDYVFEAHKQALSRAIMSDVIGERRQPLDTSFLDECEKLALRYAGQITANAVEDATFAELEAAFTREEIVELTVLASYYNFICRAVNALAIDTDQLTFLAPQKSGG